MIRIKLQTLEKNWPLIPAQYKLNHMKVMIRNIEHYELLLKLIPEKCELNSHLVMICIYTEDEIPGWTWKIRSMASSGKHSRANNQFFPCLT